MTISFLVFEKLLGLFLLMGMGLFLAHKNILTTDVTLQLSKLLTRFVAPSLFVSSFMTTAFSWQKLWLLGVTILAAFLILGVRMLVVPMIFNKNRIMDRYATLYANVGFMGTPLALAVGGDQAVFYISGFVVANQISQWTHGVYMLSKDKRTIHLKSVFINPATLATALGICLFILPLELPQVVVGAVKSFSSLNTPLSNLVLGSYFYKVSPKKIFLNGPAYQTAFWRLLGTSLISIVMIWLLPITDTDVKLALSIASTAPAALNTALLSQIYGAEYEYGSRLVLLTTTLSIVTIPLMMGVAGMLYLG